MDKESAFAYSHDLPLDTALYVKLGCVAAILAKDRAAYISEEHAKYVCWSHPYLKKTLNYLATYIDDTFVRVTRQKFDIPTGTKVVATPTHDPTSFSRTPTGLFLRLVLDYDCLDEDEEVTGYSSGGSGKDEHGDGTGKDEHEDGAGADKSGGGGGGGGNAEDGANGI